MVKLRTALVNEMRGLLMEYGIVLPQGRRIFAARFLEEFAKHSNRLSPLCRTTFEDLHSEYHDIDRRVVKYEQHLKEVARQRAVCVRLNGYHRGGIPHRNCNGCSY
ncbi:MAG: hypothetical protein KDD60_13035 [Bdellovibrionales bacterium]|nr:hypothetical protein [Bdellovibrionales bacterium]